MTHSGAILAALIVLSIAGCASSARRTAVATIPPEVPAEGVEAARAACSNYAEAMGAAVYPRDAIIRGLDSGKATVRFVVDGSMTTITSITSSDPAFGAAAADVVRKYACRADRPTLYEVPFSWRSGR